MYGLSRLEKSAYSQIGYHNIVSPVRLEGLIFHISLSFIILHLFRGASQLDRKVKESDNELRTELFFPPAVRPGRAESGKILFIGGKLISTKNGGGHDSRNICHHLYVGEH